MEPMDEHPAVSPAAPPAEFSAASPVLTPTLVQKMLAWGVHVFTSLGLAAGFMALLAVVEHDWRTAMFWLIAALVIDGVDGTFARLVRVKEVLPRVDGKIIDNVIDFVTYAFIPAVMFYEAALVPGAWRWALTVMILLVSALYYGRQGMISEDHYFVGFPVLWNLVMFYYLFVTDFGAAAYILLTLLFAVLHFVPVKVAYPSRNARFRVPTLIVFVVLMATMVLLVYSYPERPLWMVVSAYASALYFAVLAVYNTWLE
ncbi:MAG: CDP-alcohol phosphatidyltransferase family protein [Cyclonatronaceae bacterium]